MKLFTANITILFIFLQKTSARMSEREEDNFMKSYLAWMKPGLDQESLITGLTVYNFGFKRPLPFPSIALTPDSLMKLNLQTSGTHSQSRSSIAVVGERYVRRFEEIMLKVDRIHEDTQALPLAIFLQTRFEINLMNLSSHHMHETPGLVYIPLQRSKKSFLTQMKCQVTSDTTHHVLISKEILSSKSYKEICSGETKKVNLGYNNHWAIMKVENNTLIDWPIFSNRIHGTFPVMCNDWEVLSKFFSIHNIEPNWLDCNFTWGWYDVELGRWTGCMGKIERDEADIVTPSDYSCYYSRGQIAICAPGFAYFPPYWWSKYPDKIPATWNLLKLFDPISWIFIFLSILFVLSFFFFSARIGALHFGIQTFHKEIILSPFRVPLLNSQSPRLNFGFASNMSLLLWCVCGGFLLHMFLSNYLAILIKSTYVKPVDTAEDVLDRGLTVMKGPGSLAIVENLKSSPIYITRKLAERTIVAKDFDEFNEMIRDTITQGSSVVESGSLYAHWLALGTWYRSRERAGGRHPFGSYMLNKKWTLGEEFIKHMLRFQQAGLSNIEVGFKVVVEDDEPEPLRMEHFYFPLGLLVSGTLLSILCFIAEIIFHCLRKPQTDLEEPGVTQSTQEAEDGLNSNVQDIENTEV